MYKTVITIGAQSIPTSPNYYHKSTSWRVTHTQGVFTEVYSMLELQGDKLRHVPQIDFDPDLDYFVQAKIHMNKLDDSETQESRWSDPLPIDPYGSFFVSSTTRVETPKLSDDGTPSSAAMSRVGIIVKGSAFRQLSGGGVHAKTEWVLETVTGTIVWRDKFVAGNNVDLEKVTIPPTVLKKHAAYVLKCKYITELGDESNYGQYHFSVGTPQIAHIYV